jgi:GXWXG protein/Domain of unknown function (DUF4334)
MSTLEKFKTALQSREATTEEAFQLFDALEPVSLEFMIGRWRGSELHTNHPLDGFLETSNWYGKEFVDADQVHPLLFLDSNNQIFKISPSPLVMHLGLNFPVLKSRAMQPILRGMTSLLKTQVSQARLRMTEYRQKMSATMVYDYLPIHDIFRKVDDNTVLGVMDFKGVPQPFFFVLTRDHVSPDASP